MVVFLIYLFWGAVLVVVGRKRGWGMYEWKSKTKKIKCMHYVRFKCIFFKRKSYIFNERNKMYTFWNKRISLQIVRMWTIFGNLSPAASQHKSTKYSNHYCFQITYCLQFQEMYDVLLFSFSSLNCSFHSFKSVLHFRKWHSV